MTVTYSTISNNKTDFGDGGGVAAVGTAVLMDHSTVSGNSSASNGGGIYIATQNQFTSPDPFVGGSILQNDTISGNTARNNGGGIDFEGRGDLGIGNLTIAFNNAGNIGGGLARPTTTTWAPEGFTSSTRLSR